MGKATNLLLSTGLGDLTDERVVRQLEAKHPSRKQALPENFLDDLGDCVRVSINLREVLRELPRHAGCGVSGFRNEYLRALTQDFANERAASAIPLLEQFAERYANAELLDWFYKALPRPHVCCGNVIQVGKRRMKASMH